MPQNILLANQMTLPLAVGWPFHAGTPVGRGSDRYGIIIVPPLPAGRLPVPQIRQGVMIRAVKADTRHEQSNRRYGTSSHSSLQAVARSGGGLSYGEGKTS